MDPDIKRILIPSTIAIGVLHKWAEKTETLLYDAILHAFRTPSIYLAIGIGFQIGIDLSNDAAARSEETHGKEKSYRH
jgi:hypothetical protein